MKILSDQLKAEEIRLHYAKHLADATVFPTRANWEFITENAMEGIGELLYGKYLDALSVDGMDRVELHQIAIEEFPKYLQSLRREYALKVIYSKAAENPKAAVALIERYELFDAAYLIELLDRGLLSTAMAVLLVYQPEYSLDDLTNMRRLALRLHTLPTLGKFEDRRGIFGTSRKYICPNGHINDELEKFCTHTDCGLNTQGLTADQTKRIETFSHRIQALTNLMEE